MTPASLWTLTRKTDHPLCTSRAAAGPWTALTRLSGLMSMPIKQRRSSTSWIARRAASPPVESSALSSLAVSSRLSGSPSMTRASATRLACAERGWNSTSRTSGSSSPRAGPPLMASRARMPESSHILDVLDRACILGSSEGMTRSDLRQAGRWPVDSRFNRFRGTVQGCRSGWRRHPTGVSGRRDGFHRRHRAIDGRVGGFVLRKRLRDGRRDGFVLNGSRRDDRRDGFVLNGSRRDDRCDGFVLNGSRHDDRNDGFVLNGRLRGV